VHLLVKRILMPSIVVQCHYCQWGCGGSLDGTWMLSCIHLLWNKEHRNKAHNKSR